MESYCVDVQVHWQLQRDGMESLLLSVRVDEWPDG